MPKAIKALVLRNFKVYTPAKKVSFGGKVISEMTKHPLVFTNPKIALAQLTLINNTLNTKNMAAQTGDKQAIEERDEYLPIWIDAFEQQAVYVQGEANGSTTIIEQSGFHSSKTATSKAVAPHKLLIDAGANRQRGSLFYKAKAAGRHTSYLALAVKNNTTAGSQAQFVVDGNVLKISINGTEIFIQPSTKKKGQFNGLTPRGAEVNVLMVAFNTAGISPVSEPVSVIVP